MSIVEDVRKGIQDVLAPDIKAIDARLTALDAAVKEGFASSERVAAARHELILAELRTAKTIADSRHEAILNKHAELLNKLDIDKRLAKIEAQQKDQGAAA
jgi:hypothetical protein